MKYLSVCSGIEAATVAWHSLGWQPLAFSEIEKFPRKVLAHHYPDVPLHGDFTVLREQEWIKDADILVGGTPCQAFSVAGLRNSLDDDRGNLTLEFVRLADAIDNLRRIGTIIVWENVPGVLSVKDNAFGCFLGALVGNDEPLVPTGGKWTNAGMVMGPKRRAAWRVLDAQYFGVAQRRRRVFVVASARDDFDPAEVLFERKGLRRDTPPRRKSGEEVTECTGTLTANGGGLNRPAGNANELDFCVAMQCFDRQRSDEYGEENIASTMSARDHKSASDLVAQPIVIHGTQDPCVSDIAFAQGRNNGGENVLVQPIAFNSKDYGSDATTDMSPTLRSLGAYDANGGGSMAVAQPYSIMPMNSGKDYKARETDVSQLIMAAGQSGGNQGGDYVVQQMAVRRLTPRECERLQGFPDDYTAIPEAADGPRYKSLGNSMAVPVMAWIGKRINLNVKTISADHPFDECPTETVKESE